MNHIVSTIKKPEARRFFRAYLGGKMIGLAGVMAVMLGVTWFVGNQAGALGLHEQATKAADLVSPINTTWVLVTAFLVFFMQAGFMMLEGGFARSREVSNVMIECIVDTGICGLTFYAFGFAFMFSAGNSWIGYHYFFLQGVPHTFFYGGAAHGVDTGVAFMAFWLFQFAFADTASTIVSGAMVGRCGFKGDLLYSVVVTGLIYPIFGHWAWGPGGWLTKLSRRRSVTSPARRWSTRSAVCWR